MKNIIILIIIVVLLGGGYYVWTQQGGGFGVVDGEDAGPAGNDLSEMTNAIVGSWRDPDTDEVRQFGADGSYQELSGSSTTALGAWSTFTGNNPQGEVPLEEGEVYLAILVDGQPQYYHIEDISSRRLQLESVNGGKNLDLRHVDNS